MAKIISSRKKYVPVKDLKVYPSNKETIEVIPDDCNGAHRYRAQMCVGFVESLPDIANGEMTEIRIKYTAEKCE